MTALDKYLDCVSSQRLVSCFNVVFLQVQVGSPQVFILGG